MLTRRSTLALLGSFTLLPTTPPLFLSSKASAKAHGRKKFILEDFFQGRTIGKGRFISDIANINRGLTVKTHGHWDGRRLILREDFFFDDGARDVKTWRFIKIGQGRYLGRREDVITDARIEQIDTDVHLTYIADIPTKKGKTRLRFADILSYNPDGSVKNIAKVTKFGFPVGEVNLTFRKL